MEKMKELLEKDFDPEDIENRELSWALHKSGAKNPTDAFNSLTKGQFQKASAEVKEMILRRIGHFDLLVLDYACFLASMKDAHITDNEIKFATYFAMNELSNGLAIKMGGK